MTRADLFASIRQKKSYLCIGLDPDPEKIPVHLRHLPDPLFEFNRQIIDATSDLCIAYKPNLAFYEALGARGWESLEKTIDYIPNDLFAIADAKRGDVANTSEFYARAFFGNMDFDAITLSPYMGEDSVQPFLRYAGKWIVVLAHTSNPGSVDFQPLDLKSGKKVYEEVILKSQSWASADQLMYVVGATRADKIGEIRRLAPEHFFLVPGVGAQGGDLEQVSRAGMNASCGLIVNSARAILYASGHEDFADAARKKALEIQQQMAGYLADMIPKV